MSNSFLILLGIATPLIAALCSYLFRYNNNLRDSFGIIGGIVTLIISLRVFHGIQSDEIFEITLFNLFQGCLLYTSPSPRDNKASRMPSSA